MAGKGSKPRAVNGAKFRSNFAVIDWRPKIEFSLTSERITVKKKRLKLPKWFVSPPDVERFSDARLGDAVVVKGCVTKPAGKQRLRGCGVGARFRRNFDAIDWTLRGKNWESLSNDKVSGGCPPSPTERTP